MELYLWLIASVLAICGITAFVNGKIPLGVVLIVLALLVGPTGVSVFT